MNSNYRSAAGYLIAISLISFNTFANHTSAQESVDSLDRPNVPLNDQVKFIGELESRSSDRWNFAIGEGTLSENSYQLQMSKPNIRLIEQKPPQWNHTGEARNYSLLVTIYEDTPY
ncbi:MAG: hypothetical protein ACFCU5_15810 [Pleurocapsa sp.]